MEKKKREYYTPTVAIDDIYPFTKDFKNIWEFACGDKHITKYYKKHGHKVISSDISMGDKYDFHTYRPKMDYDIIISAPPFTKRAATLETLYKIGKPFAMLMATNTLESAPCRRLFLEHGINVVMPRKRIHWIFSDDPEGFTNAFYGSAWFCWKVPTVPKGITFL